MPPSALFIFMDPGGNPVEARIQQLIEWAWFTKNKKPQLLRIISSPVIWLFFRFASNALNAIVINVQSSLCVNIFLFWDVAFFQYNFCPNEVRL